MAAFSCSSATTSADAARNEAQARNNALTACRILSLSREGRTFRAGAGAATQGWLRSRDCARYRIVNLRSKSTVVTEGRCGNFVEGGSQAEKPRWRHWVKSNIRSDIRRFSEAFNSARRRHWAAGKSD